MDAPAAVVARRPLGVNGLTLAEQLWSMKPSLKVIIMSGYSSEMATNDSTSQVEVTYLAKPFELETLATTVRRCLGEPDTRKAG